MHYYDTIKTTRMRILPILSAKWLLYIGLSVHSSFTPNWKHCSSTNPNLIHPLLPTSLPVSTPNRGGDLGGLGAVPPSKFEVGDGPCIGPPNILRSSVVGWARKVGQSKKRCRQGILFLNSAFPCEERVIYDILHNKDTENLKRESQNQKNLVDD